MRYYIIITPFFPDNQNFRGSYIYDQVKAIIKTGRYRVVVFKSIESCHLLDNYCYQGIQVNFFQKTRVPGGLITNILDGVNRILFLQSFKKAKIDVSQVAFVHCHCSNNALYGLALRKQNPVIKVLLQHHDLDPFGVHLGRFKSLKWNIRFMVWRKSKLFNQVDLHVCISQWVKEYLECFPHVRKGEVYKPFIEQMQIVKKMPPLRIKRTYILYNGVDTTLFRKMEQKKDSRIFKIGCVANFQDLKQHITLLRALDILVNEKGYQCLKLFFVGTGETLELCKEFVGTHQLDSFVIFQQEVDHASLSSFYNSLDLFVLPSIFEGFGCVYLEAYACGVPFIGVRNQGAAEMVVNTDSDKWLISPYDFRRLATLIEDYYKKRYEQKLCKEYDINKLISAFLDYLETQNEDKYL